MRRAVEWAMDIIQEAPEGGLMVEKVRQIQRAALEAAAKECVTYGVVCMEEDEVTKADAADACAELIGKLKEKL